MKEYLADILQPAYKDWINLACELSLGDMFFIKVNKYKKQLTKNLEAEFKKLMEFQKLDVKDINLRLKQINFYDQLKRISTIVRCLMKIKEDDQLRGDFSTLDKIASSVDHFKLLVIDSKNEIF